MDMLLLLFMYLAMGSTTDPVHDSEPVNGRDTVHSSEPVQFKRPVHFRSPVNSIEKLHNNEAVKSSDPVPTTNNDGPYISALKYLTKYGYLDQGQNRNFSLFDSFENSLRRFQEFFSMTQSGELDSETVRAMKKPRCGVVDTMLGQGEVRQVDLPGEGGVKKRQKRYSFYDSFFFQDIMDLFRTRIRPFDTPSR